MRVYRIAHRSFIKELDGAGAHRFGGRWNPQGVACVYCSQHLSLSLLEKLAHAKGRNGLINLSWIGLDIPDSAQLYMLDATKMKVGWQHEPDYTQWLGHQVLKRSEYLGFMVPSVIVPTEYNIVLNPGATAFVEVKALTAEAFFVDERLRVRFPE